MKHIVIGTAGHIDHGKTTLVKALTGIDTDRLKEEKKRGISIELGFAQFMLPDGRMASIIDVPGHERFIKNMLAGATGIDLMLLVVAADDGVMPQTVEHLAISMLLGVEKGVVAVTKADLVESDWLEMVKEEIKTLLKGTSFENAPIIPVSPITGLGVNELIEEISEAAKETLEGDIDVPFRLPIDRVFVLKGIGTVVTGTLWSGVISVGDKVEVLPKGTQARIRSLEVHNQSVERAYAGQRVAINLVGVSAGELERGDVLLSPNYLRPSSLLEVKLHYLLGASKALKNRTRIRFHHGTQEILGRIVLLGSDELLPGQTTYAKLILESPTVPKYNDRFIIRSYSPSHTIGGGRILDSHPLKHKRFSSGAINRLKVLDERNPVKVVLEAFIEKKDFPLRGEDLFIRTEISAGEVKRAISLLLGEGKIHKLKSEEGLYVLTASYESIKKLIEAYLKDYASKNPLNPGEKREIIRARFLKHLPPGLADEIFSDLVLSQVVIKEGDMLRHPAVQAGLGEEQKKFASKISEFLKESRFSPPTLDALEESLKVNQNELRQYLKELIAAEEVVRVRHDLYFHKEAFEEIKEKMVEFLREKGKIEPGEFKELFGISRKYALPLLEYFDAQRVTRRVGNDRVLWE